VGIEKARASLIDIKGDPRVPMAQIHALFAGKGTVEQVLAAAEAGKVSAEQRQGRLFYAHLYLALYYETIGNAKLVEEHLRNATGPYGHEDYMGDVARVHLKLLSVRKPN
jgi:lipoprotein NlpI